MTSTTTKNWIAVASADHARRGRDERVPGFMQVGHGKLAPLKRVQPGDRVAYYSPRLLGSGPASDPNNLFQSFVSIGIVQPGEPYAFDMGGFVPYRRNVIYLKSKEASILPLLDDFEFVENRAHWGYKFRFGLFTISDHDMRLIGHAMGVDASMLLFR